MKKVLYLFNYILVFTLLAFYGVACEGEKTPEAPPPAPPDNKLTSAKVLRFVVYKTENPSLAVDSVEGEINEAEKKITLPFPTGTNFRSIKPSITINENASVSPESGVETDFTNPVEYTVTAPDGQTKAKYTVSSPKSTEAKLLRFVFYKRDNSSLKVDSLVGDISEADKQITVLIPRGANIQTLKPTITISRGASVSPQSGREFNFTDPVKYTVTAEDGKTTAEYTVTASLNFITSWRATNTDLQIALPLVQSGKYGFTVDWGDGTKDNITTWNDPKAKHSYTRAGTYTVMIFGRIEGWSFGEANGAFTNREFSKGDLSTYTDPNAEQLIEVSAWGPLAFGNTMGQFLGAKKADFVATDVPDLSNTESLRYAFAAIGNFDPSLNSWDVSKIKDMRAMFAYATAFNHPLDKWDVRNVEDMSFMFANTTSFNQPLNSWTLNVKDPRLMFENAKAFNQPLNNWDLSKATTLNRMFAGTQVFNQHLEDWNISKVTDLSGMFDHAVAFNGKVGKWDVSNVTNMSRLFAYASSFNQSVNDWVVSNVTDMSYMFAYATAYRTRIDRWEEAGHSSTNKVTNCYGFFDGVLEIWQRLGLTSTTFPSCNAFTKPD